jgi:hypothetical protein
MQQVYRGEASVAKRSTAWRILSGSHQSEESKKICLPSGSTGCRPLLASAMAGKQ